MAIVFRIIKSYNAIHTALKIDPIEPKAQQKLVKNGYLVLARQSTNNGGKKKISHQQYSIHNKGNR